MKVLNKTIQLKGLEGIRGDKSEIVSVPVATPRTRNKSQNQLIWFLKTMLFYGTNFLGSNIYSFFSSPPYRYVT